MTPRLPAELTRVPVAHRALHDVARGRPENSRAAIRAAMAAGYPVELDLQLSRDGRAMVFHDYDLGRLTGVAGPIRGRTAAELAALALLHGDGEAIPEFTEILDLVGGQVPLLIELKDQDGGMGPDVGALEAATAAALSDYAGPVAVMSFNPHSVGAMARLLPQVARGLVTDGFDPSDWPLSAARCDYLRAISDFDRVGAAFISHDANDLDRARVRELKAQGVPILCWTVRSPAEEARARRIADNITFEGYTPPVPAA